MFCDDTRILSGISCEADVESLQEDLNRVFAWADTNNMKFNSDKFELLRYGKDEEIKFNTIYFSADDKIIEEKEVLRDLGLQMNNKADFSDHIRNVCQKAKQKSGWIVRTLKTRSLETIGSASCRLLQPAVYASEWFKPHRS